MSKLLKAIASAMVGVSTGELMALHIREGGFADFLFKKGALPHEEFHLFDFLYQIPLICMKYEFLVAGSALAAGAAVYAGFSAAEHYQDKQQSKLELDLTKFHPKE